MEDLFWIHKLKTMASQGHKDNRTRNCLNCQDLILDQLELMFSVTDWTCIALKSELTCQVDIYCQSTPVSDRQRLSHDETFMKKSL